MQDNFFHIVDDEGDTVRVVVHPDGERYEALIDVGWWVGYGATKKKAVDAVMTRRNKELSYFGITSHGGV